MKNYMRVEWIHSHPDEPVVLWSEIEAGWETRKVEVYREGRLDYADRHTATGTTRLSEEVMPALEEIAAQDEFVPEVVDGAVFERVWGEAKQQHSDR